MSFGDMKMYLLNLVNATIFFYIAHWQYTCERRVGFGSKRVSGCAGILPEGIMDA